MLGFDNKEYIETEDTLVEDQLETADDVVYEIDHVDTLIEGTEAFLGLTMPTTINGVENYAMGVMIAEGVTFNRTGNEGIGESIMNGLRKIWEGIKKAFLAIKNFFTSKEKKASAQAKEVIDAVEKELDKMFADMEKQEGGKEAIDTAKAIIEAGKSAIPKMENVEKDAAAVAANIEKSVIKQEADLKGLSSEAKSEESAEKIKARNTQIQALNKALKIVTTTLDEIKNSLKLAKTGLVGGKPEEIAKLSGGVRKLKEGIDKRVVALTSLSKSIVKESSAIESGAQSSKSAEEFVAKLNKEIDAYHELLKRYGKLADMLKIS